MMNDKYEHGMHIITNHDAYVEQMKLDRIERQKQWAEEKNDGLSYLERKRRDGLIDPPTVEEPENVDVTYEDIIARKYEYIVIGSAMVWDNETMLNELLSAGRAGLLRGIRTWNQAKGAQATYFNRCVKNAMINVMRKEKRYRETTCYSLDDVIRDTAGVEYYDKNFTYSNADFDTVSLDEYMYEGAETPHSLLERKQTFELLYEQGRKIAESFGSIGVCIYEWRIMQTEDYNQEQIAQKFGVTQQYISKLETRILKRLQKELENQN